MNKPEPANTNNKKIGRPGVSREEVFEAIKALSLDGHPPPTLRKVQSHLGGGSLATISKFRQELSDRHEDISEEPIETRVKEKVEAFVREMNQFANNTADAKIDSKTKASEHSANVAYAERDKMRIARDHIEERALKAEKQLGTFEKRAGNLEDKLSAITLERDELREVRRTLEKTLANSQASYEKDVELLKRSLTQIEKEKKSENEKQKRTIKESTETIQQSQNELEAVQSKLEEQEQKYLNAHNNFLNTKERVLERDKTIALLRTQLDTSTQSENDAKAETKKLTAEYVSAQEEQKKLLGINKELSIDIVKLDKNLEAKNNDLVNQHKWYKEKLKDKESEIAALHKDLDDAKRK